MAARHSVRRIALLAALVWSSGCRTLLEDTPFALGPPREHVVRRGETACSIGGRYGVSPAALMRSNRLAPPAQRPLPAGKMLRLPSEPAQHRVRPGDTLSRLAVDYGVSVSRFLVSNELADPDQLAEGSLLRIPRGARSACPPAPQAAVAAAPQPAHVGLAPLPAARIPAADAACKSAGDAARRLLGQAEQSYDAADFRSARELAHAADSLLREQPGSCDTRTPRARAAWIEGAAYAGLEDPDKARVALRRAAALDASAAPWRPLSPKLKALLEEPPDPRDEALSSTRPPLTP